MPYTTIVAGTTITSSWANLNVRDQVITPFASEAARDSAIAAPPEGIISYQANTNNFTYYNNASWVSPGKQLIGSNILGSNTASVSFSSLPTYFNGLELYITGRSTAAVTADNVLLRLNADSGANYSLLSWQTNNSGGTSGNVTYAMSTSNTAMNIGDIYGASAADSRMAGSVRAVLPHFTNTTFTKMVIGDAAATIGTTAFSASHRFNGWFSNAAVTSLTLTLASAGSFQTNTRFHLYGNP